jgi:HD-GYP domain-containing protein (c-di-GMP phosphodiesterase class II)
MSETQVLLSRIVALRQRLEQVQGLAREAGAAAAGLLGSCEVAGPARLLDLEARVAKGGEQARQLDASVRPLTTPFEEHPSTLPTQLTVRARRALERGRDLLAVLRELAHEPAIQEAGSVAAGLYRECTAVTDAALRLVRGLPDSPSAQLHQCEGIEGVLEAATRKLASLTAVIRCQREETGRLDLLAGFLSRLASGDVVNLAPIGALAEALLDEAADGVPLRFLHPPPASADVAWVARAVACHSLTVAQVVARLVRHDPDLRGRSVEAVLAALVHDAGMLTVPPAVLAHPGPLEAGRRAVEAHCHAGVELLARCLPADAALLTEAVGHHHERCDGTGYPNGLREQQVSPVTRLLAVCDVYAAGCTMRPHRLAREPRTALTDVLLLAEQGLLDSHFAERLLQLSFYPPGSVVELADGAVGVVVAAPVGRRELNAPARPVLALLIDAHNHFLPAPRYVDLAQGDSYSIVRTLPPAERRRLLGARYPEWAS